MIDGTGATLARLQYTYDALGNRLTATRSPRPSGGLVGGTWEDQASAYDALSRLVSCDIEHQDGVSTTLLRGDDWDLDLLGNWRARVMAAGGASTVTEAHETDARNRIDTLTRTVGAGSPQSVDVRYDAAGNLTFDGTHLFQYDAWNRLLQVNRGHLDGGSPPVVVADGLVKHFAYDGLGRLARTQSPYPFLSSAGRRSERFYYDGIRRIQEVIIDPVSDTGDAAAMGDPGAMAALTAEPELDTDAATLGSEESQLDTPTGPPPTVTLAREYVWGPGDNGVDELLAQYGSNREPAWALQDAGLDIIALADLGASAGSARVAWQGTYDAYGSVLSAETLYPHAPLRAGHKGLFFDRLDADILNPSTGLETPRLAADATTLAHVRNRVLYPSFGRWLQKDPNASALTLVDAERYHGASRLCTTDPFDLQVSVSDDTNLFGYIRSNPFAGTDPLGLAVIPEGVSPFDLALVPTILGILSATEQRLAMLAIQHYANLFIAAEIALGAAGADPTIPSPFAGIGSTGRLGEGALESLGGIRKAFKTRLGWRVLDRVVDLIGWESKVGRVSARPEILRQVAKDEELLRLIRSGSETELTGIVWIFFKSPVTGEGGPTPQLLDALLKAGIKVVISFRE